MEDVATVLKTEDTQPIKAEEQRLPEQVLQPEYPIGSDGSVLGESDEFEPEVLDPVEKEFTKYLYLCV